MTITGRALTVNDPLWCATLNKCILFPLENSHPWKPLEQVGWQGNQLEKYSSEGHPKFRHEKTASKRYVINNTQWVEAILNEISNNINFEFYIFKNDFTSI